MKKIYLCIIVVFMTWSGLLCAGEIGEIDIHGFISQGYLKSTDNNYFAETEDGTFQFNEMGINFVTWVSPDLSLGMQFFASDLGDIGNDDIKIDWAYADYRFRPYLGIGAGKIKLPIGLYNETRDIDSLRTSIFLPPSLYLETAREPMTSLKGLGAYGFFLGRFSYQFLFGTQEIDKESGIGKMSTQNIPAAGNPEIEVFDVDAKYCGALEYGIGNLKLKTTYTFTDMNIFISAFGSRISMSSEISFVTFSGEYTYNDLVLAMEYSQQVNDMSSDSLPFLNRKTTSEMAYVSGSNRFTDWFEFGAYYSWMFTDKNNKRGNGDDGWFKDTCVSFKFDINMHWMAKIEGHYFDGNAMMLDDLNPEYSQSWYLFAMKMSYLF